MSLIIAYSLGQCFFLIHLLERLNPARDCTSISHKTKGDLFRTEMSVYIVTPKKNLHLVKAKEFWHLPASAFVSFLISGTLLVLVNSCSPCHIILRYVRRLLNSGFCSDAVLLFMSLWYSVWVELERETINFGLSFNT